jgi:hypothetical protein
MGHLRGGYFVILFRRGVHAAIEVILKAGVFQIKVLSLWARTKVSAP